MKEKGRESFFGFLLLNPNFNDRHEPNLFVLIRHLRSFFVTNGNLMYEKR